MYAQCPECLSVFSLDARSIAQARGRLRCGHCGAGFDGLLTLTDWLPAEPFEALDENVQTLAPIPVDLVVYRPRPEPAALDAPPAPGGAASPPPGDFAGLVFAPRSTRGAKRRPRQAGTDRHLRHDSPHRAFWALACSVLLLALGAQVAWAARDTLLRDPTVGAWLRAGCARFDCALPLVAAPAELHVLDSVVQTHPHASHALLISAHIRNDAAFAQPYPLVTVTLSDTQGKRIAMRRLPPREYLDDAALLRRGLAPGASTVLVLEVVDPGRQAAAFELGFR